MATESTPTHLDPSPLGTKEYWDELYDRELANHAQSAADVGTIWFNDSDAEDKVVRFLYRDPDLRLARGDAWGDGASFLDLGTGNGHFLVRLRRGVKVDEEDDDDDDDDEEEVEEETDTPAAPSQHPPPEDPSRDVFKGRMLGVDYSAGSVSLAARIAQQRGHGAGQPSGLDFCAWDFMAADALTAAAAGRPAVVSAGLAAGGWDVVHDKGTFDAISLSGAADARGRRVVEGYRARALALLRPRGLLVLTSCNWTEEELKRWFVEDGPAAAGAGPPADRLRFVKALEYRSFSFGGQKGQTVCTLCFQKE